MLLEELMSPCPTCGTPFEYGEETCSSCLAWLTSRRALNDGARGFLARRRTARTVVGGTKVLLAVCFVALILIHYLALQSQGLTLARDISVLLPAIVVIVGILLIYGIPGRTLHLYPGFGLIRRGTPRLWKGAAASAAVIINAIVACELAFRPALEQRAVNEFGYLSPENTAAITVVCLANYAAVALVLLWNLVAHAMGPQEMLQSRRQTLMQRQARTDGTAVGLPAPDRR